VSSLPHTADCSAVLFVPHGGLYATQCSKKSEVKMGVKRHCMKINLNYYNLTKIQFIWDDSSIYVTEKSEKMSLLFGWSYLWLSRNIQNLKNIPFESKIKFVKVT